MECYILQGFDKFGYNTYPYCQQCCEKESQAIQSIENCISERNGEIQVDAEKLQKIWFPGKDNYDIFISHSHSDIKTALKVAHFLNRQFGKSTFIDSQVWHNYKNLKEILRHKYKIEEESDLIRLEESLHMMLTTRLFNILTESKYFFFIDTPNSLKHGVTDTTFSPWLYFELTIANFLQERLLLENKQSRTASRLKINFKPNIKNYKIIQYKDFIISEICNNDILKKSLLFDEFLNLGTRNSKV